MSEAKDLFDSAVDLGIKNGMSAFVEVKKPRCALAESQGCLKQMDDYFNDVIIMHNVAKLQKMQNELKQIEKQLKKDADSGDAQAINHLKLLKQKQITLDQGQDSLRKGLSTATNN